MFTGPRLIAALLLAATLFATPAAAGTASAVDLSDCSTALRVVLNKEDIPSRKPALPKQFELEVSASQAADLFAVGAKLYHDEFTGASLEALIDAAKAAAKKGAIDEDQVEHVHSVRATLKQMRFLFVALDRGHECPDALDELATALGKMRDHTQGEEGDEKGIASGQRAREALGKKPLAAIDKSIAKFEPDTRSGFHDWLSKQARVMRKILGKPELVKQNPLVADDVHDLRKALQAILSVYFVRSTRDAKFADDDRKVMKYLEYITEDVGGYVVEFEEKFTPKQLKTAPVRLRPATRKAVTDFIDRLMAVP